jgi:hypothetical protein
MSVLEEKLATLADGTEGMCCTYLYTVQKWSLMMTMTAVAFVLSNWHNVLRAISMASSKRIFRTKFWI